MYKKSRSVVTVRPIFAKMVLNDARDFKVKSRRTARSKNFARRNNHEICRGGGAFWPPGILGLSYSNNDRALIRHVWGLVTIDLSTPKRISFKILLIVYKSLCGHAPSYITTCFNSKSSHTVIACAVPQIHCYFKFPMAKLKSLSGTVRLPLMPHNCGLA